jgi:hypothetical protein
MKVGLLMLAGSVLSAYGIVAILGAEADPDVRLAVWLGMAAPLAAAMISTIVIEHVWRTRPADLTKLMTAAFAAKLILFAGYVALIVKMGWVEPISFATSFTGYFLVLHVTEALHLRRLFITA